MKKLLKINQRKLTLCMLSNKINGIVEDEFYLSLGFPMRHKFSIFTINYIVHIEIKSPYNKLRHRPRSSEMIKITQLGDSSI